MSKFCQSCGSELIDGANACTNCGALVNSVPVNNVPVQNNYQNTAPANQTNGLAIAGLIVSILCCGSLSLVSLILSILGLTSSKKMNGSGKGMAIAGIIISAIGMILSIISTILYFTGALVTYGSYY